MTTQLVPHSILRKTIENICKQNTNEFNPFVINAYHVDTETLTKLQKRP